MFFTKNQTNSRLSTFRTQGWWVEVLWLVFLALTFSQSLRAETTFNSAFDFINTTSTHNANYPYDSLDSFASFGDSDGDSRSDNNHSLYEIDNASPQKWLNPFHHQSTHLKDSDYNLYAFNLDEGDDGQNSENSHTLFVKVGTQGIGVDYLYSLSDKSNLRFSISGFSLDENTNESGISYDVDFNLLNAGVIYDFYPGSSLFRLSAGLFYNGTEFKFNAKPDGSDEFSIDDTTYDLADVGSLSAKIDFNSIAPYIGFGMSKPPKTESGFALSFDLGLLYQNSPNVDFSVVCNSNDANLCQALADDVANEERQLSRELDSFKIWPVISFGLGARF